jgi:hypothetical protein
MCQHFISTITESGFIATLHSKILIFHCFFFISDSSWNNVAQDEEFWMTDMNIDISRYGTSSIVVQCSWGRFVGITRSKWHLQENGG